MPMIWVAFVAKDSESKADKSNRCRLFLKLFCFVNAPKVTVDLANCQILDDAAHPPKTHIATHFTTRDQPSPVTRQKYTPAVSSPARSASA